MAGADDKTSRSRRMANLLQKAVGLRLRSTCTTARDRHYLAMRSSSDFLPEVNLYSRFMASARTIRTDHGSLHQSEERTGRFAFTATSCGMPWITPARRWPIRDMSASSPSTRSFQLPEVSTVGARHWSHHPPIGLFISERATPQVRPIKVTRPNPVASSMLLKLVIPVPLLSAQ